jgi:putative (di)nucleoside polyphosphate hydrolase
MGHGIWPYKKGARSGVAQWWHHARYRLGVGVLLVNREGLVWAGKSRSSWQMPQGGIGWGEEFEVAAKRELKEETGITTVRVLARMPHMVYYNFPSMRSSRGVLGRAMRLCFRGQRQQWFLMVFDGQDTEVNLKTTLLPEFSDWAWMHPVDILEACPFFKRGMYESIFHVLMPLADPKFRINR